MEPQSPAPSKLRELTLSFNLDSETEEQAKKYYEEFEAKRPQEAVRTDLYVRCAAFVASKTTKVQALDGQSVPASYLSVTHLVRSLPNTSISDFIVSLLTFTETIDVSASVTQEILALKQQFAFSQKFYDKFQDLWSALGISDRSNRPEVIQRIRELSWLFFLVAKQQLISDLSDVIETTNLLIAVIHCVASLFPGSITTTVTALEPGKSLEFVCAQVKSRPSAVSQYVARVEAMFTQMHKGAMLRTAFADRLEGLFASVNIPHNLQNLHQEYASHLKPAALDERDFISSTHKVGTPVKQMRAFTPFAKHSTTSHVSHRVIKWEEIESQLMLDSNMKDVTARTLSQQSMKSAVATPVTLAMEMNNWLHDQVEMVQMEGILPASLLKKLKQNNWEPEVLEVINKLGHAMARKFKEVGLGTVPSRELSFIEQHFSSLCSSLPIMCQEYLFSNSKVDLIVKLCGVVLDKLVTSRPDHCISEACLRGVTACCIETTFFLHNLTSVDFEEVLELCACSPVNFWTQLSVFVQLDSCIPVPLRQHLRRIEVKILSCTAWTSDSIFKQLEQSDFASFLQRVLTQAAHRTLSLGQCLLLSDEAKEAIWTNVKFVLSECTELLKDRHLDQLVLCTVFATCRMSSSMVPFNSIIEQYTRLNPEEAFDLTHKVTLDDGQTGTIIVFYNKVFLPKTRIFITGQSNNFQARHARLCPPSPLRENLPAPPQTYSTLALPKLQYSGSRSPFLTPRSQMLYASSESPIKALNPNIEVLGSQRKLPTTVEGEKSATQYPAFLNGIVGSSEKLPFPLPHLKQQEDEEKRQKEEKKT